MQKLIAFVILNVLFAFFLDMATRRKANGAPVCRPAERLVYYTTMLFVGTPIATFVALRWVRVFFSHSS